MQHWKAPCVTSTAAHEQEACKDTSLAVAQQADKPQQLASALRFDLEGTVVGLRFPDKDQDQLNAQASLRDPLRHAQVLCTLLRLSEEHIFGMVSECGFQYVLLFAEQRSVQLDAFFSYTCSECARS